MNGKVYDVSSFYETHPGGKRIMDVTGLDGTHVFRLVSHDVNPEVMGRMASYEIGRLHTVDPNCFKEALSSNTATSKVTQFYEFMVSFGDYLAMIVETENCFVNDLSSICAMFEKGSTAALKEKHLRHHVQVLNTFVGRLCSVAFPQIFSDHFIHLYDATKFIISALPDDIRGRLDGLLQSASEEVQRARGISNKPELKNILVLVLSVRDFFHFSQPARKTKGDTINSEAA